MADVIVSTLQIRLSRREQQRLLQAFVLSVAMHLLVFGSYKAVHRLGWEADMLLPRWLKQSRTAEQLAAAQQKVQASQEPPLMFVNVSPAQAAPEAPKDAKFYSDKNSRAANPEADQDTGIPKITGMQEQVPRTEDVPRSRFDQLQPALPAQPRPPTEEARAKPSFAPGDLTMARPDFNPRPDTGTAESSRPRTLAEARARQQQRTGLPGEKMKQDGGVKRRLEFASLDAKATPFGAYDAAFIEAVSQRWYDLLDQMSFDGYQRGKVMLQFALNYDGRITDMQVIEKTVGEALGLLCEMAVLDPAPYAPWPTELRRLVGSDQRKVQFTFYYN